MLDPRKELLIAALVLTIILAAYLAMPAVNP